MAQEAEKDTEDKHEANGSKPCITATTNLYRKAELATAFTFDFGTPSVENCPPITI